MMGQDEDVVVIKRVLQGETDSFELLVERYQGVVAMVVASKVPRENAAEVAHDVFIRVYKSLSRYAPDRPLENWIKTIAVRTCHDYWRARYRNRETPVSSLSEKAQGWVENYHATEGSLNHHEEAERAETRELLNWALDRLKPTERMIILLTYFEGYSVKETGEMLDMSAANVKVQALRARRKLRKILGSLLGQTGENI